MIPPARLTGLAPCAQCGFPVAARAARCPDCGRRQRLLGRAGAAPIQTVEAGLSAQVTALAARRQALEAARSEALQRLQGATPERAATLGTLVRQLEQGLSQVAALIGRCNEARRAVSETRFRLTDAALRSVWQARLHQPRRPAALGSVATSLRWTETSPCQAAVVSPSGRRVALVGGGGVLLVDLFSQRARKIDATGAHGVQFSADERLLRFPSGATWGCETGGWLPLPGAWRPAPGAQVLALASLPHDLQQPAPDPRFRLETDGGQLRLTLPALGWHHRLLALPGARGVHLQAGVLVVSEPDVPRVSLYRLQPARGLCWDAWALRTDPELGGLAEAVLVAGLVAEMGALGEPDLGARAVALLDGVARMRDPMLTSHALQAVEAAVAQALHAALCGEGAPGERAGVVERLARAAAAAVALGAEGLRGAVAAAPGWVDALQVEAASGVLMDLTGGEALRVLAAQPPPSQPAALPPGAGRLAAPDAEDALRELADIQRDIGAQLAAIADVQR